MIGIYGFRRGCSGIVKLQLCAADRLVIRVCRAKARRKYLHRISHCSGPMGPSGGERENLCELLIRILSFNAENAIQAAWLHQSNTGWRPAQSAGHHSRNERRKVIFARWLAGLHPTGLVASPRHASLVARHLMFGADTTSMGLDVAATVRSRAVTRATGFCRRKKTSQNDFGQTSTRTAQEGAGIGFQQLEKLAMAL